MVQYATVCCGNFKASTNKHKLEKSGSITQRAVVQWMSHFSDYWLQNLLIERPLKIKTEKAIKA